ncbi:heparinase II/III domain-containing protein [Occultella kanbiaonis]|uniref:heparinase II/III domain-containing protein n=1 Tax=Occultella kanbiaonis TaxID=2675754 RepID=UPI0012B6F4E5|nr:heparinase II/III family protein [Occultella kanbiaonis]
MAAGAVALALVVTGLPSVPVAADEMSDLGGLLDLARPELAPVAARLAAGDEAGAADELQAHFANRTGIELPVSGSGIGDATADELAAGTFRFGAETRDFYNDAEQRIDVDWQDPWGGTAEAPGGAQVLMSDLSFMGKLTRAYQNEDDPQLRATYAAAWMDISLDFFADNPTWATNRNLSGAKRLSQLVAAFAVFRAEPTIEASDLTAYLIGVHATTDHLVGALQRHVGNNWYLSMARSIYLTAIYLPEFSASYSWEWFAVRSVERFMRAYIKGDGVYREPAFNYQAYVADLLNTLLEVAHANGRTLPDPIPRWSDWIADSLFATRQPNLEPALIGDSPNIDAGIGTIRRAAERNSWSDFAWVASGRTEGTVPTLPSTLFPISFAVQRSGWDADAQYMLINNQNSSYTASHRHPDDLSLVMAAYGRPLIVDPGVGDYSPTPTNQWMRYTTEAHNTVEVDGAPQAPGVTRRMSLWRTNEGLDIYQGEAFGYQPVVHDRVVYFVKPGFWVVSDSLTGDTAAHDYRQLWHFPGDPVTVDPSTNVATIGFDTVPGAEPVTGVQLVPVTPEGVELAPTVHDDGAVRVGEDVLTDVDFLSYDWSTSGATGLDTVVVPGAAGPAPTTTATRIELPGVTHSTATAMQIDLPDAVGRFYLSREDVPSQRVFGEAETDAETAYLERSQDGGLTRYSLTRGSQLLDDGEPVLSASGVVSDVSVDLVGATAEISIGDPFTGTITINAPDANVVMVNGSPAAFTRSGDQVTVTTEETSALNPVLTEEFADTSLDSTVYAFDGSLEGWTPVLGDWAAQSGALTQSSTADMQSFAAQQGVPNDAIITAEITPGTSGQRTTRTGFTFRYHDASNYYRANVLTSSAGVTLQLVKVYNGTSTTLAESDLPLGSADPYTMTVSAIGRHLVATVGDTSIAATDSQLPTGGAAAYTHRRAATFDNITISEGLDQANWQGLAGEVSVNSGQLNLTPVDGWAHVLAASTLPPRFSLQCDYAATATVTINGVGNAGISLRDTSDTYGYRIHIGRTSSGSRYVGIVREAQRSGPVTLASVPLTDPLTGPVRLGATIQGDHIVATLNGVEIAEARDTVVRSGGVGLYASTASTFENLTVEQSCDSEVSDAVPAPPAWDQRTPYTVGDLVAYSDSTWVASWWTQNQVPGDAYGPWQEVATTSDGTALWTPTRIFIAGDVVEHQGHRYEATWWTRNQVPGTPNGPWRLLE